MRPRTFMLLMLAGAALLVGGDDGFHRSPGLIDPRSAPALPARGERPTKEAAVGGESRPAFEEPPPGVLAISVFLSGERPQPGRRVDLFVEWADPARSTLVFPNTLVLCATCTSADATTFALSPTLIDVLANALNSGGTARAVLLAGRPQPR
jgi:hypothetical protein